MRYGNQTIMYDDIKDMPVPHNTIQLENSAPIQSIPEQDDEATTEISKKPNPQTDLVEMQEHFQQFLEWLTQLEPTTNPSMHAEELAHLTNKLQQLDVDFSYCWITLKVLNLLVLKVFNLLGLTLLTLLMLPNSI